MKTKQLKKVLIALDYDPTAQKVAEMGYLLAQTMGAKSVLMHVIEEMSHYAATEYSPLMGVTGYMNTVPLVMESVDELKKSAYFFLNNTKHHLGDETMESLVKEGDPADAIVKAAREQHADLIVIGSHSRRWIENIIMGSVSEKVLHHSSLPVFVIPTKKRS